MAKKIEISDFIKKQKNKKKTRNTEAFIEFDGDLIPVNRPSVDVQLKYLNGCTNAISVNGKMEIIEQNMNAMFEASRDFVFACCPFMRNKELIDEYECEEPFDVVAEILGVEGTINFASDIKEKFEIEKTAEEIEEEIKN